MGQTGLHLWVRHDYTYGSDMATPMGQTGLNYMGQTGLHLWIRSVSRARLHFCVLGTLALFPREQAGVIVNKPHLTLREKGMYSPNRSPDGTERQKIES